MGAILLKNIVSEGVTSNILIEGGIISKISAADNEILTHSDTEVVECEGKAVVPGFINMHSHAGMSMMRGVGEDIAFHEWLDRIWKIESKINAEYVYHATKVACLEMIKSGTTYFNEHYWYLPAAHRAVEEMGMRATFAYVICDRNDPNESQRQKEQCRAMYEDSLNWSDESKFAIAIHAIYSVSEEMILWGTAFAREHGLKIHIHLSETKKEIEDSLSQHGMSPVEYFDKLGVLGPDVIAAHTLWLSENDISILGVRGVTCVHNINSNLKLTSGYKFLYKELRDAGANICLGTDGCASSNNLDMLETMKTSAMVQKAWRGDPMAMQLDEIMNMVSLNAANALGINTGKLAEGYDADLLIINTENPGFLSPGKFEANLVYSAHSDCVESVISKGKFIMRNRVIEGEKEILAAARKVLF